MIYIYIYIRWYIAGGPVDKFPKRLPAVQTSLIRLGEQLKPTSSNALHESLPRHKGQHFDVRMQHLNTYRSQILVYTIQTDLSSEMCCLCSTECALTTHTAYFIYSQMFNSIPEDHLWAAIPKPVCGISGKLSKPPVVYG